jgi:hypothetical protein
MKKTTRILTVLALAASSVLYATPSQAVPTVNIAIDCVANVGARYDQPVAGGWVVVATFTNCTTINPNWPIGTSWELKSGATTVAPTTAGVQGSNASGLMQTSPQWNSLSASSTYVLTVTLPDPLPAAYMSGAMNNKNSSGSKSGIGGNAGGSSAVHYFITDPSYVPGGGASTTPSRVRGNVKATLDSVTFKDDGTGTAGTLTWKGTNIDSVRYVGPATTYPSAFNYGAYTSSWNGALTNLTPDTTYTFEFYANSIDDYPAVQTVSFKTGPAVAVVKDAAYWTRFVDTYVIYAWEAANMKGLMAKFNALETSPYRSFIKVPTSRVSTWSAISLTPKSCRAETNGVITALNGDTCTVSYTVSGASKAPVTLVRDFTFTKFSV